MAIDNRYQWGAAITSLIADDPRFCEAFGGIRDDEGRAVIVPALATDTVVEVTKLVFQAGGQGTVVVLDKSRRAVLFARITAKPDTNNGDSHVPMTEACTIGDLFAVLTPGVSITYRLPGNGELGLDSPSREDLDDELVFSGVDC